MTRMGVRAVIAGLLAGFIIPIGLGASRCEAGLGGGGMFNESAILDVTQVEKGVSE